MKEAYGPLQGNRSGYLETSSEEKNQGGWEEYTETIEDKRFRLANLAVFAIQNFCASLGEEVDDDTYREFHAALRTPDGYFQWTPSNPSFKRITVENPSKRARSADWNGDVAAVIENGTDSVNRELTDKLNSEIKSATGNAWLVDEDI